MDRQQILSSPIMTNYLSQEAAKKSSQDNSLQILAQWNELQENINSNPQLRSVFLNWQKQFRQSIEKQKLHPKLAQAVMSLYLREDEE